MTLEEFKFIFWMEYGHRCVQVQPQGTQLAAHSKQLLKLSVQQVTQRNRCAPRAKRKRPLGRHVLAPLPGFAPLTLPPTTPCPFLSDLMCPTLLTLCRMWGRLLGVTFLVPGTYFLARGFINRALAKRLGLLFFMGGTQGLVGWWMVRSGLKVRVTVQ